MKDLEELKYFLEMQVTRNCLYWIHVSQSSYISKILKHFDIENCNSTSTLLATGTKLLKMKEKIDKIVDQCLYQQLIESQMYSMVNTHPDTIYLLSQISQYNASLNSTHETAAKWELKYLAGTVNVRITYNETENLVIEAHCNADYAAREDRKSISGIVIMMVNGAVSWQFKKQSTVATFTTEVEYVAIANAAKELI